MLVQSLVVSFTRPAFRRSMPPLLLGVAAASV